MVQAVWYATASSPIDPLAITGEQRQLLLNRLLLVEAGLARVEQRFAQDSPLEGGGFEPLVPPSKDGTSGGVEVPETSNRAT
jgi:hypothetical protein